MWIQYKVNYFFFGLDRILQLKVVVNKYNGRLIIEYITTRNELFIFAFLNINNNKSISIYFSIHLYNHPSLCSIYQKKNEKWNWQKWESNTETKKNLFRIKFSFVHQWEYSISRTISKDNIYTFILYTKEKNLSVNKKK